MNNGNEVRKDPWLRRILPHSGMSICEGCVEEMTIAVAARELGILWNTLSRGLNGQRGTSPQKALTLEAMGWSIAAF